MRNLPLIAVTMGDPAGIGPEICIKALQRDDIKQVCRPFIVGDIDVLKKAGEKINFSSFHSMSSPLEASGRHGIIDIMSLSHLKDDPLVPGKPTKSRAKAMVNYVLGAANLCKEGEASAMVTCPISKEVMHFAEYRYDGHTELLAHLTGTKDYVMMLAGSRLRVSLVSIHCAIKEVPQKLTRELISKTISITCRALNREFHIKRPHVAVAALNPHAGESGLFGTEESEIIRPAIYECRRQGMIVEGPLPPDTIFYHAVNGKFDAVVAMYHDQGLIPFKLLHFSDGVNITLGLPIIRTSVDHGTAYDIVGKGEANPSSLVAAIKMAAAMAKDRDKRSTI
ncbi:MAG: 4-hydroxythreonine-4-phosphate dehydrogenase PdxA [Thermodesulfobacteriota bacterium]|nr:4-hydroxythreonine-4-phosphate dehydrogenase PdxA [Thermodesulfobacteriota bacterium]